MRSVSQQIAVKMALSSVVICLGIAAIGCDRKQADVSAVKLMDKGDYQAAAREKQASPSVAAIAAGLAADEQFARSFETYARLCETNLAVNESLWSVSRLSLLANRIFGSGTSLAKYDPQQSLAAIDQTVKQVKGDGQQTWATAEGIALPSVAALTATTNQLKDQIAETERSLSSLSQKRDAANQEAQRADDESRTAKGEKGIELVKKAADARKAATDLQVQIDQAGNTLVSLKQQLALAEAQGQSTAQTVETLAALRENIEKSWRGILAQAEQRSAAAAAVYGKSGDQSGTVIAQATKLAELIADQDKQAAQYEQQLQQASTFAKDSVSESEKAIREAGPSRGAGRGPTPATLLAAAMDPAMNRFVQGHIDYSLGAAEADQAILLGNRDRAAVLVAEAAKALNQTAPEAFDPGSIRKAQESALTKANDALKSASDLFVIVGDAPAAIAPLRQAANFGQLTTLHASAMIAPDAATAKGYLDQARALRDKLLESGGRLPALPPSLQGGAPAAPASAPTGALER